MSRKVTRVEHRIACLIVGAFNLGLPVLLALSLWRIATGVISPGGPDSVTGFGWAVAYAILAGFFLLVAFLQWLDRAYRARPDDPADDFWPSSDDFDGRGF